MYQKNPKKKSKQEKIINIYLYRLLKISIWPLTITLAITTIFLLLSICGVVNLREETSSIADRNIVASTTQCTISPDDNLEQISPIEETPIASTLEVHFMDVGQADATLLICDGEALLLDAGDTSKGTMIQLYLNKQGVKRLKYLILTHPDEDHIGGADVIINKYDIENVFMTSFEKDTKAYTEVMDALDYRRLGWHTPSVGSIYRLGEAIITIIAPNRTYSDVNESSIGILVSHGENTFLFTGDAGEIAEADILNNGINIDCDVFKAGHHGSKTANTADFLNAASPEYVVISCGEENSYGHPHAGPMNLFRNMGIKLFRTDEQGTIVAKSNGETIIWNMSPTDSWRVGEGKGTSSVVQR